MDTYPPRQFDNSDGELSAGTFKDEIEAFAEESYPYPFHHCEAHNCSRRIGVFVNVEFRTVQSSRTRYVYMLTAIIYRGEDSVARTSGGLFNEPG